MITLFTQTERGQHWRGGLSGGVVEWCCRVPICLVSVLSFPVEEEAEGRDGRAEPQQSQPVRHHPRLGGGREAGGAVRAMASNIDRGAAAPSE
jgi:hypothetical protein